MATFPGSYVAIGQSSDARVNYIIDNLLNARILAFRQVSVDSEQAVLMTDGVTWRVSYQNWNDAFPRTIRKNKAKLLDSDIVNLNELMGTFEVGPIVQGDMVHASYNFDYFGIAVLYGFILTAVDTINSAGQGSSTNYTIDNAPSNWDGVIADLVGAMCMEKLLLDYDLWSGRLIFAIGGAQLEDGGGDITGTLTTLKQNFEERAQKSLDNPRFKYGNVASPPTQYYYQAIRGFGGSGGAHNVQFYGKLRGYRPNKYL